MESTTSTSSRSRRTARAQTPPSSAPQPPAPGPSSAAAQQRTTRSTSKRGRSGSSSSSSRSSNTTTSSSPKQHHRTTEPRKRPRAAASSTTTTTCLSTALEGDEGNTKPKNSSRKAARFQRDEWNRKFDLLCAYQREHGHCRVPNSFVVVDDESLVRLGLWVANQRKGYHTVAVMKQGQHNSKEEGQHAAAVGAASTMSQERIRKLNSIGFQWRIDQNLDDAEWQQKFELLCTYQRDHGHSRVPRGYAVDSVRLGAWADKNRVCYRNHKDGKKRASMKPERIAQLESIGFQWIIKEPTADNDMWHRKYNLLSAFKFKNGHCRVPKSFVVDSVQLGEWVVHQRYYYKNYKNGKSGNDASITEERIALLNAIGFEWMLKEPNANDDAWQHNFSLLCDFKRENGHCKVPQGYVIDSVNLGDWVSHQRRFYKKVRSGQKGRGASITEERISQLDSIGFSWALDGVTWEKNFELLSGFRAENGHCRVPKAYTVDSVKLGEWVSCQRQYYKNYEEGKRGTRASINKDRIERLDSIRFEWIIKEPTADNDMWHHKYNLLSAFKLKNGHCRVPKSFVVDSFQLGEWVARQRYYYKNYNNGKSGNGASITEERIARLNEIGFEWMLKAPNANDDAWQHNFSLLCDFKRENGHCRVPQGYVIDSVNLGDWVNHQRRFYKKVRAGQKGRGASITEERISQLDSIGFSWAIDGVAWEKNFELLGGFRAENGHCRVPKAYIVDSVKLGEWVSGQRRYYKNYKEAKRGTRASINEDRIERLDSIGFEWALHKPMS